MRFEIDMEDKFKYTFINGGTTEVQCRCGRNHVAILAYDCWDDDGTTSVEDIKDSYEKMAKEDEMLILNYEVDSIEIMEFGGAILVADCECEGWISYMEFMIEQRRNIAEFLIATSKEIKRIQSYEDVMDILEKEYE